LIIEARAGRFPVLIGDPMNTQNPGVTTADVEANIKHQYFFTAADGVTLGNQPVASQLHLLTFCVLVTDTGHTITGEAHCQDPARFDAAIGRTEARKDAINKLWPMVVYAARDRLKPTDPEAATDTQDAS
jgi:hypothetical protein